jgi:TRAP-type C4-dicarboxylate transport system permease small subunit
MLSMVLDPILKFIEYAIVGLALAMMAVAFVQVVLRYGFNSGFFGSEELARYLFTWFIFFSATLGLERGIHFAVDVIVNLLPGGMRRLLQTVTQAIIIAIATLLVVEGTDLTIRNWAQHSSAMDVPLSWPYAAVPVSGLIMVLICLRQMIRPEGEARDPEGA